MSNKIKTYNTREFTKLVNNNGFSLIRCSGGHKIYGRGTDRIVINTDINAMICRRIIKEFELIT